MYGFMLPEEQYDNLKHEVGWFDETPLERLADIVITELREELSIAEASRLEAEDEASCLDERVSDLEQEIRNRREDEEEEREDRDSARVEELENEVDFLKTLVTDMEEELAALDVAI
jgi:flagellar motility protein MotE (MotC chaperone)